MQRAEENRKTVIEQKMQKASRNSLKIKTQRKGKSMAPLKGIEHDEMTPINETWELISEDNELSFDFGQPDKNDYKLSLPINISMGGLDNLKGSKNMKSVQEQVMIVDGKKFTFNINVDIQIDPIE